MKGAGVLRVTYKKSAFKALKDMQPKKANDIRRYILERAANPAAKDNNLKPLVGVPGGFRRRFGGWRVSFTLDADNQVLGVFEIKPRGGAYR